MARKILTCFVTVFLIMFTAVACENNLQTSPDASVSPTIGEGMELIPVGDMVTHHLGIAPGTPGAANDDIVPPPGGWTYRAKVHEQDKPDWPPVDEVVTTIEALGGTIRCQYREYIETKGGEIRNNILYLFGENAPDLTDPLDIEYYVEDLFDDIGIILGGHGYGGIAGHNKQSSTVIFQIDISSQISPGVYTFSFVLMYEGKEIAVLPCTINVIE